MPKIHTYSNDLQQLPWNVRVFRLIAHRGFHKNSGEGENTLGAFIKAHEMGVYGSEIDVWVTADRYPVVYHNDKYNGARIVETNYIGNLEFKIPSLKAFLDKAEKLNTHTKFVLDIKPRPEEYPNVNEDIKDTNIIMDVIGESCINFANIHYLSFSEAICEKVAERTKKLAPVYLLIDNKNNSQYDISALKNKGINGVSFSWEYLYPNGILNSAKIDEAKKRSMNINVWTVGNINMMRELLDAGVDNISTDDLAQFLSN